MTKGDLGRPLLSLGTHQHLRILWILCHHPPIWPLGDPHVPLAFAALINVSKLFTAGFRSSKYWATSPGRSFRISWRNIYETVQKQFTTNILDDDPYRWEVNKNQQLHSFDPSDLRCLVWSQTSHIFTHIHTLWTWQIQMDTNGSGSGKCVFPIFFSWR